MGAPTVSAEKLDSNEGSAAVEALSRVLPRPITALLCAEVGGGNSLEPLAVGLHKGLPVVDADLMGRVSGPCCYMTPCSKVSSTHIVAVTAEWLLTLLSNTSEA
jgi:DUF917 family protein